MQNTEFIVGTIVSEPRMTENRVTFTLQRDNQQLESCLSGAGTTFSTSQFRIGARTSLIGEHKENMVSGGTPSFIFSEVGE